MKISVVFALLISSLPPIFAQHELSPKDHQSIMAVVRMQEDAWNKGDIEKFMTSYWKSEHTVFTGASGPQFGWDRVLNRYLKSYPDKQVMGNTRLEGYKPLPGR